MVSVIGAVGLLGIVFVNAAIAALVTRFFRVQLVTDWGSVLYTVMVVPVLQVVVLFLVSGVFKIGPAIGGNTLVIGVAVVVPLVLGGTFDYFWMPAPEELDVPDQRQENQRRGL